MTTKAKLVSTIAAFCLVLALMVVGVLAATSATVNLGGTISFTAQDVVATVTAKSTGAATDMTTDTYTKTFNASTAEDDVANVADWDDISLQFANKTTDIVITVTITNNAQDGRVMSVTPTLPTVTESANVSISGTYTANEDTDVAMTTKAINLDPSESAVFKITLHIIDQNQSVVNTTTWGVDFALANVG